MVEGQFLHSNNRHIFINIPMIALISTVLLYMTFSLSSISLLSAGFQEANTPYLTCVLPESEHNQGVAQNRLQIQGPLS
jgi:hypothetical protein